MIYQKRPPANFSFEHLPHIMIALARGDDACADAQLKGAQAVLDRVKATYDVITVPSVLEIPASIVYAVRSLNFDAIRRRYDGYVALGCVVQNGAEDVSWILHEGVRALQNVISTHTLAVGNGLILANTKERALDLVSPDRGDGGGCAAEACLKMIELKNHFRLSSKRRWVAR